MIEYKVTDEELTAVADAIRTKGDTSEKLEWHDGFVTAIEEIPLDGFEDGTNIEY